MVMATLKGVHRVRKPSGRVYYYAWRGGPRMESTDPNSEAFQRELVDLKKGRPLAEIDPTKFLFLVVSYTASDEYRGNADSTKALWKPWIDKIKERFGHLSIKLFDRAEFRVDIRNWLKRWSKTPRTRDVAKQVLSRILTYGVEEGRLLTNLCGGIPNLYDADRSEIIWTPEDIDQVCAVASVEVAHAVRLASLTGLRLGDLLRLSWGHIGPREIVIPTGKSRRRRAARVPVTKDIRTLLSTIPKRATCVLTNSRKKAWTPDGFGSSWWKAKQDSGLGERDLHFHDLRGTAATNFYRAGLTIRQIAEVMAWSEEKVEKLIDRYVKRDAILDDMVRKIEGGNG
jgi:integrase